MTQEEKYSRRQPIQEDERQPITLKGKVLRIIRMKRLHHNYFNTRLNPTFEKTLYPNRNILAFFLKCGLKWECELKRGLVWWCNL